MLGACKTCCFWVLAANQYGRFHCICPKLSDVELAHAREKKRTKLVVLKCLSTCSPRGTRRFGLDFVASLRNTWLDTFEGIRFALLFFLKMDMGDSGSIDEEKILALFPISHSLLSISRDMKSCASFLTKLQPSLWPGRNWYRSSIPRRRCAHWRWTNYHGRFHENGRRR